MAHTAGITTLIDELLALGHEFSFVQIMRLARRYLDPEGEAGIPGIPWQERVHIRPELSLAFPAADVSRVERDGDDLSITATFLGLYGSASPLPTFYTEELMDEAACDESVFRDFLDIIHQRLYHLYFQCWSKYRLLFRIIEENDPIDRERLLCLIGLGEKELAGSIPDCYSLLRYSGILTQYPRSASGLATILRDMQGRKDIRIMQNMKRMVPIPADQRMKLGLGSCSLGIDTVLGSEIADRMGKFRIRIGPLTWDEFSDHLPGTARHDKLTRYTRFYLTDPLEVDVELVLAAGEARPIRLGDPASRIGLNTWCFSGDTLGEVSAVFRMAAMPGIHKPHKSECALRQCRTFVDLYREERAVLDREASRFVERHPGFAPLMSGQLADPGVERLFEGTAFLNALLQRKLDDDFPEFMHEVMNCLDPNTLRPIPASTIIAFTPKPNLTETHTIPAGTELNSVPVDGTQCRFTTNWPVEINPLNLTGASFAQPPGKPAAVTLNLELAGIDLSNWKADRLCFFLAGEYKDASNLYLVLMRHVTRIIIASRNGGRAVAVGPDHLKAAGFEEGTETGSDGYRLLRDYFIQPERFLFVDLVGLEMWRERGNGSELEIRFELENPPFALHKVTVDDFKLFVTPAVNLFEHQAKPISLTDRTADYPICPEGSRAEHYHVHSVEKVSGFTRRHADPRVYTPEERRHGKTGDNPLYRLTMSESLLHPGIDFRISVVDTIKSESSEVEILDVALKCTNGNLPNRLAAGEICMPAANSPAYATFENLKNFIPGANTSLGNNHLWKRFSSLGLNHHLISLDSLRSLLETGHFFDGLDCQTVLKRKDRLKGIVGLDITAADRLVGRSMQRCWEIRVKLHKERFASDGDMYLFSAILDRFMALFITQSAYTRTVIEDMQGQREYSWPERMGKRPLV